MIELFISVSGIKMWYLNNSWHRANGPAIAYPNGNIIWFWYDYEVDEYEHMMLSVQEITNG